MEESYRKGGMGSWWCKRRRRRCAISPCWLVSPWEMHLLLLSTKNQEFAGSHQELLHLLHLLLLLLPLLFLLQLHKLLLSDVIKNWSFDQKR